MESINISKDKLRTLKVIKPEYVWTDGKLVYKKDYTYERRKEYLDILKMYDETKNCILPECGLNLNDKPFGYITRYDKERDKLTKHIVKGSLFYREKLEIIKELIKNIKDIHSVGLTHGDLHSDNILYSKNGIKLIDFDNSTLSGVTSNNYHIGKVKDDLCLLSIDILSILSDFVSTSEPTYIPLIQSLDISEDFKDYLISAILYKDKALGIYPDEFIKEINGDVERQARKLIRSLK